MLRLVCLLSGRLFLPIATGVIYQFQWLEKNVKIKITGRYKLLVYFFEGRG